MDQAYCPVCGKKYWGWALHDTQKRVCPDCHVNLINMPDPPAGERPEGLKPDEASPREDE